MYSNHLIRVRFGMRERNTLDFVEEEEESVRVYIWPRRRERGGRFAAGKWKTFSVDLDRREWFRSPTNTVLSGATIREAALFEMNGRGNAKFFCGQMSPKRRLSLGGWGGFSRDIRRDWNTFPSSPVLGEPVLVQLVGLIPLEFKFRSNLESDSIGFRGPGFYFIRERERFVLSFYHQKKYAMKIYV